MTLVVGLFDEINQIDNVLNPLFNSYNIKPDNVEVLVHEDHLSSAKTRTKSYTSHLHAYNTDIVDELTGRGVPKRDAMFFSQGLKQGKELILVEADDSDVARVRQYLSGNARPVAVDAKVKAAPVAAKPVAAKPAPRTQSVQGQETFEVIEENIQVGKRTVEKGGVKVEKVVEEKPFREEVSLREEHVEISRNPVNRAATSAELRDGFEDETFVLKERAEEVLVKKDARVVEEVTLGKRVEMETEVVSDTIRRVDVRIEEIDNFGDASMRYEAFRPAYQKHYSTNYSTLGSFEEFENAYRYGHAYGANKEMRGMSFRDSESTLRSDWEGRYGKSTWDKFSDAVEHGWNSIRAKF